MRIFEAIFVNTVCNLKWIEGGEGDVIRRQRHSVTSGLGKPLTGPAKIIDRLI